MGTGTRPGVYRRKQGTMDIWTLVHSDESPRSFVPGRDEIPRLTDGTFMFWTSAGDAERAARFHREEYDIECYPVLLADVGDPRKSD